MDCLLKRAKKLLIYKNRGIYGNYFNYFFLMYVKYSSISNVQIYVY